MGIAGHQATVIPPVETDPRQVFPRLILKMGGLIECLIVVDAEHFSARDGGAQPADLWRAIARPNLCKDRQCPETMEIRHPDSDAKPPTLLPLPPHRDDNP